MKILVETPVGFERNTFLSEDNIALLNSLGDVVWNESDKHLTKEELRDALEGVSVCVCGWSVPQFDSFVLEKANDLKLVAYTGGSVGRVVSDAMYAKGIRIVCGNEAFAESVAEGCLAYILTSLRRIPEMSQLVSQGSWKPKEYCTESLYDQTVGIVGYGAISRYLLKLLKPFHVKIKLYSHHMSVEEAESLGVSKASLEEIFSTCKIISLHCARSSANYHLIDARLLGLMQDDALLVNTARGDIIDQEELIRVLETGRIRAALDVFEHEPLDVDSPLRCLPNVFIQPHLGGPTIDRRQVAAKLVIEDIARLQTGEPLQNEVSSARVKTMTQGG